MDIDGQLDLNIFPFLCTKPNWLRQGRCPPKTCNVDT